MTRKLKFKLLSLAVMLASMATVTWLDTPAYAACSPTAYEYCMGRCSSNKDTCLEQAASTGSTLLLLSCHTGYDSCTCDCGRTCFGSNVDCSGGVGE